MTIYFHPGNHVDPWPKASRDYLCVVPALPRRHLVTDGLGVGYRILLPESGRSLQRELLQNWKVEVEKKAERGVELPFPLKPERSHYQFLSLFYNLTDEEEKEPDLAYYKFFH